MTGFAWTYQPSGLGLRQDEFSIQGSFRDDPHFYLRRDYREPRVLTDFNFGALGDEQICTLLAEFLSKSGGLQPPTVAVTDIARQGDEKHIVVARYDRTVEALKNAIIAMGFDVQNAQLDQKHGRFNAIVQLTERANDR
ncbi:MULTISPECIES: hypothetical protein [Paracoccus]|uniref:Uncharacterized protein n=1 Tax=Paracoccus versutus TaxID=34007 RepID=A0A3D9XCU3_PARVE|nr:MULTISPECIES: hypothetical protein [Paracoccus]REF68396.1 hypothetical protein BDD41_3439 [Paracoccus versutus]WGR59052.1 hypothetical protein E3U25_24645 [Paracoccus versutus]SFY45778.1 hypothetical protein SAMN04244548_05354 [Paracoccus pantotrophus]